MKTKIEIIDIVAKSYTSTTRAIRESSAGTCQYLTKSGRRCGVGMFLNEDSARVAGGCMGDVEALEIHLDQRGFKSLDSALIEEVRGHSYLFWSDIQMLHDAGANWDSEGLSTEGKEEVDLLKQKYA